LTSRQLIWQPLQKLCNLQKVSGTTHLFVIVFEGLANADALQTKSRVLVAMLQFR
jgi:hypothetical protein